MTEKTHENLDEEKVIEQLSDKFDAGDIKVLDEGNDDTEVIVQVTDEGSTPSYRSWHNLEYFRITEILGTLSKIYVRTDIEELPDEFFTNRHVQEVRKILEEQYNGLEDGVEINEYNSCITVDFDGNIHKLNSVAAEKLRENRYLFAGNDHNVTFLKYEGE
jgi:hypothetical protein